MDRLLAEGFSNQDVSVLMSDNSGSKDFATEKNTKAPEGRLGHWRCSRRPGRRFGWNGHPGVRGKTIRGRVKDGGILLSVHCDTSEEISRAKDILKATGADDIASSGEKSVSTHGVDTDRQATDLNDTERIRPSSVDSTRREDESVNRKVIGGR